MAKKKSGKKKGTSRYRKVNGSVERHAGKRRSARRTPRAQVLPGMEQVRDTVMDRLCEDMGESLELSAKESTEQKGLKASALKRMTDRGMHAYQHAGTRFTRIEGSDKISAKRVKEDADASVSDVELGEGEEISESLGDAPM